MPDSEQKSLTLLEKKKIMCSLMRKIMRVTSEEIDDLDASLEDKVEIFANTAISFVMDMISSCVQSSNKSDKISYAKTFSEIMLEQVIKGINAEFDSIKNAH